MSKYLAGYLIGRRTRSGGGGGGLAVLFVVIAAIVGVAYVVYRLTSAIGGFTTGHPWVTLFVVGVVVVLIAEGSKDTTRTHAGYIGVVVGVTYLALIAFENWVSVSDILYNIVLVTWGVGFFAFLWALVRFDAPHMVGRVLRSAALVLVVWGLVASGASLPWIVTTSHVQLAGVVVGILAGFWGLWGGFEDPSSSSDSHAHATDSQA